MVLGSGREADVAVGTLGQETGSRSGRLNWAHEDWEYEGTVLKSLPELGFFVRHQ